jgi:hypothetical protein
VNETLDHEVHVHAHRTHSESRSSFAHCALSIGKRHVHCHAGGHRATSTRGPRPLSRGCGRAFSCKCLAVARRPSAGQMDWHNRCACVPAIRRTSQVLHRASRAVLGATYPCWHFGGHRNSHFAQSAQPAWRLALGRASPQRQRRHSNPTQPQQTARIRRHGTAAARL